MKSILLETALVALIGTSIGFVANVLSPKGVALSRNYFPVHARSPHAAQDSRGPTNDINAAALSELAKRGIQLVGSNFVAQAFADPKRRQQLTLFIDAREQSTYLKGHIPGAYLFDYYHPEAHLQEVLPALTAADTAIIYCNGGSCEDSEMAAVFIQDAGVPASKLRVYTGGFNEWVTNNMPVEIGPRGSGTLHRL